MSLNPNLDLMRAIAVLCVVVDHTMLAKGIFNFHGLDVMWLGVFGVYLFFVHTCLVLMWSLERRPHALDFYVRRAFRIYPLAIVSILVMVVCNLPMGGDAHHPFQTNHYTFANVGANLLLVQNVLRQPDLTGVLWSLPLEVQMYLLLPMLFLYARREAALWPLLLLWGAGAAIIRSQIPSPYGNSMLTVIPHFLPGVIAYVGYKRRKERLPGWTFPLTLGIVGGSFMMDPQAHHGWFACLFLGLALPSFQPIRNRFLIRASHLIAKYSYGIYLFHAWGIVLAFHTLRGRSLGLQLAIELATVGMLSVGGYHLIEHPMVRLGSRVANRIESKYESYRGKERPTLELA